MIGVSCLFFFKESASSHFRSIDGHPELKIIVPPALHADISIVLPGEILIDFRFPNPKPDFDELFDEKSSWTPFRISFTDETVLISFQNRNDLEIDPENPDIDIYDTRDYTISRPYVTFPSFEKDGVRFLVDLCDVENEKMIETYSIQVLNDGSVIFSGETACELFEEVLSAQPL